MRTGKKPNSDFLDAFDGEPTPSWFYANWKPLYIPRYRWQPHLSIVLPLRRSPPHVVNQCYDKIPISYKNAIFFVYPITRQTYPDAQVRNCSDRIKNIFQFDLEDEHSCFTITFTLEHRRRPAVFGPKHVTPVSGRAFGGAGDVGIYTRAQLFELWDNILIMAASGKLFKNSIENQRSQYSNSWTRTLFLLCSANGLLCGQIDFPSYFKNQFMDSFGSIAYVLEICGIFFSLLFLSNLSCDPIAMVLRHMEIHRLTGASLGFGKTLLSVSFNLFLTSILTFQTTNHFPCWNTTNSIRCWTESTGTNTYLRLTSIYQRNQKLSLLFLLPLLLSLRFSCRISLQTRLSTISSNL